MTVRMLGTGYGECKTKKKNSKDYRKSGGVLIDDKILIDAPLDIFEVADELGLTDILAKVTDVIISHSHPAHFSAEAIAKLADKGKISIYATRAVLASLTPSSRISMFEIGEFTKFQLSEYEIITIPTNHKTENHDEKCLNFIISGEKSLFYALDGGFINTEAFAVLKSFKLDALIMDTALEISAPTEKNLYHNDVYTLSRIKDIFTSSKITHEATKFILSHIPSPRKREMHEELSPIAKECGLTLAYDGYFLRI